MSKEYLFNAHSFQLGNSPVAISVEVALPYGRTLRACLPTEVADKLTRIVSAWVQAEEKRAIVNPVGLDHETCCSCGSCVITEHEPW